MGMRASESLAMTGGVAMVMISIIFLSITLFYLIIFKLIEWIIVASVILLFRHFWVKKRDRKRIKFEKENIRETPEEGFLEIKITLGMQCPHNLGYWDYYATKQKRLRLPSSVVVSPARILQCVERTFLLYLRKEKLSEFFKIFRPNKTGVFHFFRSDVYLDKKKNMHANRIGVCCDEAFGHVVIEIFDGRKVIHNY